MESERRTIKETSSLSQSRKGPKTCYGATRNPESTADYKLFPHTLSLSDTLQGLAIKYGVTVEQIRRVNKMWTNDNILIFKTIYIPMKLTYDDHGLTAVCWDSHSTTLDDQSMSRNNPGTSRVNVIHSENQKCDSEESVDSGVHEVNHGDISVTIEEQSKIDNSSNNSESLNSFLKKFDSDMKASIKKDEKQRASAMPMINQLRANQEGNLGLKIRSNHVKLKSNPVLRTSAKRSSGSLDEGGDDLFEL